MSDWVVGAIYLLGVLHAIPAWHFGKAAGIRYSIRIMDAPANPEPAEVNERGDDARL